MEPHPDHTLTPYYDGELNAKEHQRVSEHLQHCAVCRSEIETWHKLSALLQNTPPPPTPQPKRFAAQVVMRLPRYPQRKTWPGWYHLPALGLSSIFWAFEAILSIWTLWSLGTALGIFSPPDLTSFTIPTSLALVGDWLSALLLGWYDSIFRWIANTWPSITTTLIGACAFFVIWLYLGTTCIGWAIAVWARWRSNYAA